MSATTTDQTERIRELEAALAEARKVIKFYANPKNWWNENVDNRLEYHNANLSGSIERMNAKVGVIERSSQFAHPQFFNDGGDRARDWLSRNKESSNG